MCTFILAAIAAFSARFARTKKTREKDMSWALPTSIPKAHIADKLGLFSESGTLPPSSPPLWRGSSDPTDVGSKDFFSSRT